ncbi:MAG: hypothetical protein ACSLE2_20000, partial [Lysobacterales bacterium]
MSNTVRCKLIYALFFAVFMGFSFTAFAQSGHGISVNKECDDPVRLCSLENQDTVCGTDACDPSICDLTIQEAVICRFTVQYFDSYG